MSRYKNIILIFSLIRTAFFNFFCFSICKIVDSEYGTDDYKPSKISIGTIIKNPEMLNSFQITLKLTLCKHAVKKLPFKIRYVPDQYKNQQMCDKAESCARVYS